MNKPFSNLAFRRTAIVVAVLVVALFFVRPGAGRLRWRATQSITQAFGRPAQIGSLQLRFLPRLGFELQNLTIYDDPSFGSEPLLRAPSVTASLRLFPLLSGKIEISNLNLNQASLNLTRDDKGRWNLQDLLQRTPNLAPGQNSRTGEKSGFPYIEADQARINFKLGAEKTHFALTDAKFALWQDSATTWGMRVKARPMRTDANLTDTGVITVNGLWQRSPMDNSKPLNATFQWKQVQLGQASSLIFGQDKGWRGTVLLSGALAGTPDDFAISLDAGVDDFRRYEVIDGGDLQFPIQCTGDYSSNQNAFSSLNCRMPAGNGSLQLTGGFSGLLSSYDLKLSSASVPAEVLLAALRHTVTGIPQTVNLTGVMSSQLRLRRSSPQQTADVEGEGSIEDFVIPGDRSESSIRVQTVPFSLATTSAGRSIQIGPANIQLGRPAPLQLRALLSSSGYQAELHGEASVKRLLDAASTLHLPAPATSADGAATLDLTISRAWDAGARPLITGTAQLRNVTAPVRGLNSALDIRNANLVLASDSVRVQNINAQAGESSWKGSLLIPRPCPSPADCVLQFSVHSADVSAASLNKLLNPNARKASWYKLFSLSQSPVQYLLQARASGKISIDRLNFGEHSAGQFATDLSLDRGKLTLTNFHTTMLGAKLTGTWKADFKARPPAYSASGSIDRAPMAAVASLMHDDWMDGLASAEYEFKTAGWSWKDLLSTADLTAGFVIQNGIFPHVVLAEGSGPLRASRFSGKLALREGEFSLQDAKLLAGSSIYNLSGTATLDGALNLKMMSEGAMGYNISGTFTRTRVAPAAPPPTRASLKP